MDSCEFNQDNKIICYNADSLILMDEMIRLGVNIDCVVTDPPYPVTSRGSAGNSGGMLQKDINKKGKVFNNNDCHISKWCPKVYKLLKEGGHAYFMTNDKNLIEYLNIITDTGFHFIKDIIWKKDNKIMGQYYMGQKEHILFFRKGKGVKITNCGTSDVLEIPNKKHKNEDGSNWHDTEKPVELMKILIENSTKENELVLDPFVGVGATPMACYKANRRFIGAELDKQYFNITVGRLNGTIKE